MLFSLIDICYHTHTHIVSYMCFYTRYSSFHAWINCCRIVKRILHVIFLIAVAFYLSLLPDRPERVSFLPCETDKNRNKIISHKSVVWFTSSLNGNFFPLTIIKINVKMHLKTDTHTQSMCRTEKTLISDGIYAR